MMSNIEIKKVLFVSYRDVSLRSNGGELCTNRNYLSFCELIGKDNVTVINLMDEKKRSIFYPFIKRVNYLFGYNEGLTRKKLKNILLAAKENQMVFIDTSLYGVITQYLRLEGYKGKVVCFFHNVETKVRWEQTKINPLRIISLILAYYNERKAIRYADEIVVLNRREQSQLEKLYNAHNVTIIPISLKDRLKVPLKQQTSFPPTFIFIGNDWYANIHGLRWFVDNVLDHVNIRLQITGYGMEKYRPMFTHPKIEFHGFVDDLDSLLLKADYVLSPIFYGSGMKVKTCEALMFGKNIVGTNESFEGYNLDYEKVGALCNTRDEFIMAIKKIATEKRSVFNEYSRKVFLTSYSFYATLKNFQALLS